MLFAKGGKPLKSSDCKPYLRGSYTIIDKKNYLRTFQIYYDPIQGKTKKKSVNWKRKGFKTEKQALRYLKEQIEQEVKKNAHYSETDTCETFGELTALWLKSWAPTVRQTTVHYQKEILARYLQPHFPENLRLQKLSPLVVEEAWADILSIRSKQTNTLLEKATLEKIGSLLKQILAYGYRHDLILFDLNKFVLKIPNDRKIRAIQRRKNKFLEKPEISWLLQAINEKYETNQEINKMGKLYLDVVEFMIRNGLRIGEVSALTTEKVDFSRKLLMIDEGLVSAGRTVKEYIRNPPKTIGSIREIGLDTRSIAIIQNRIYYNQLRQKEMKQREIGECYQIAQRTETTIYQSKVPASKKYISSHTIFQTQNGTPVVSHSLNEFLNGGRKSKKTSRCIKDILKEKYPQFQKQLSSHTFRYTHISLLAEAGMPIKAIMERVGHFNMKTTLEIYNQVSGTTKEKLVQEVDSWIF
ncbi:tyrosine-type recombinase/integrase [Enterococcus sp. AZ078]|uniref:tyrosine-type recombinase/integrase n=1 Tax=Enterococcus sp. AZ078 TaxID=2774710 RepID=UPI003F69027C